MDYLEESISSSARNPSTSTNSHSSLSPPAAQQTTSISLPSSPFDTAFTPLTSTISTVAKSTSVQSVHSIEFLVFDRLISVLE